ncbi:porin family protein [Spirosoma gilvum]
MKTERFDEEFRRKLLGLPAEVDPGDVERIQGFVKANKPALPGLGWGKLLLYGGGSLLLIGSLSYNVIQNYRNTHLQSSIDSLSHRSVEQASSSSVIRHDTVYITRSGKTTETTSFPNASIQTDSPKPLEEVVGNPSTKSQPTGSLAMGRTKLSKPDQEVTSNQVEEASSPLESRTDEPITANPSTRRKQQSEGGERSGQVRTESDESVASLSPASVERSTTEKVGQSTRSETLLKSMPAGTEGVEGNSPNSTLSPVARVNSRRSKIRMQTAFGKEQTPSNNDGHGELATNYSRKQNQGAISGQLPTDFTLTNKENANSGESMAEANRQTIIAEPLASLQTNTTSTGWKIILPSRPLSIPVHVVPVRATRRSWHLTMPSLSVPNAQYRIGTGLTGGSDQAGGALLGEIMLNRHWSVQAGVQLGYSQGFNYRDEQDFNEHQKEDFRETYASQVPSSSTIQDIQQMTFLAQIPIQVAYHYPFGRQWGLRLGLGTDLNLWGRSVVSFDYRENSRSSEHELARSNEHVHAFKNLMLSTTLERSWRKWQFRAGPFISPQLRSVDYKRDDLSWGANLQIFYRLGK